MRTAVRCLASLLTLTAVLLAAPAHASAWKLVVRATYEQYTASTRTITYQSSKGTYSATWIGPKQYRLRGTIAGKRLTGTFRTRQRPGDSRYKATGSGRLGDRSVRIGGGGPNNLRTAKLVLRDP
jgi:hypothetical protein